MLFAGFLFTAEINEEHSLICFSVSLPAATTQFQTRGKNIVSLSRENGIKSVKKEAELANILLSCVKLLYRFAFLYELFIT